MALSLVPREGQGPPAFAPAAPWVEAWWASFTASWSYLEKASTLYDPRQLRTWWLADMSRLSSEYLRSSSFLALMRFSLK
jgi:hypothetical protein